MTVLVRTIRGLLVSLTVLGVASGSAAILAQTAAPPAQAGMTAVLLIYEGLNSGDYSRIDSAVAANFVDHRPAPGQAPGREGVRQRAARARASFPDLHLTIDDQVVEGDLIAVRATLRGTQNGPFRGIAPTGKPVTFTVIDVWRVAGGKVTEAWHVRDDLDIVRQLGALPGASGSPARATPVSSPFATTPPASVTADATTIEANKMIARRWNDEIWGKADRTTITTIVAPDLVFHEAGADDDLAALQESVAAVNAAFPDRQYTVDLLIAEGDRVVIVWSGRATQQGETFGVPPSGTSVALNGIDILRVRNGKIVEAWSVSDNLGLLTQLGAFPPAATPANGTPVP